ncbi:MAG TPA: porin [Polyangiales bacterium]
MAFGRRLHAATTCALGAVLLILGSVQAQAQASPLGRGGVADAGAPALEAAPAAAAPGTAAVAPSPAHVAASAPGAEPAAPAAPAPAAGGASGEKKAEPPKEHWYDKIKLRGYTQFRYNRLPSFDENDKLVNDQGDRTLGKGNGFSIRRARLVLLGDVHEHVSIYLQVDFASAIDTQLNVGIVRDWYTDLFIDKAKTFRFRVGQSKVPYGFENMQSSQNRLPLDRNDATNSAFKDERDIGVFFYWAPAHIRQRFRDLVEQGLKGSGDYGVFGLGAFNGQGANKLALEDNMHGVVRLAYPFLVGKKQKQILEPSIGGYYGQYRISTSDKDGVTYTTPDGPNQRDARAIAGLVLYPQPFGFVIEGNYGIGPAQGKPGADDRTEIEERPAYGAWAQIMWKFDPRVTVAVIPFVRASYYDGGKKFETNVPHYHVKEIEVGIEWQIFKALELVLAYDFADRTSSRAPYYREKGQITRVQLQVNY